ncbi:hypothetical protein C8R46DRAFT_1219629 [Mycena filopes]|nr:hypothetical protein C8R46DRAFT_1219629 [Mycena filopes]
MSGPQNWTSQPRPDFSALSEPAAIETLFDALDLGPFFVEFDHRTTSSGTGNFSRHIDPIILAGMTEDELAERLEHFTHAIHHSQLPNTFHVVIREARDAFEVLISRGGGQDLRVQWTIGARVRAALAPLPVDIPRGLPAPGPIPWHVCQETLRFWEDVLRGLDVVSVGQEPSATITITNPEHENEALARINSALDSVQRGRLSLPPGGTIYPVLIRRRNGTPIFHSTSWDVPFLNAAAPPPAPGAEPDHSPSTSHSNTLVTPSPMASPAARWRPRDAHRYGQMPPPPPIQSFMPRPTTSVPRQARNADNYGQMPPPPPVSSSMPRPTTSAPRQSRDTDRYSQVPPPTTVPTSMPRPTTSAPRPRLNIPPKTSVAPAPTSAPTARPPPPPPPAVHPRPPVFPGQPAGPPLAPWPPAFAARGVAPQFQFLFAPQAPVLPQFRTAHIPFLPAHAWGTLYGPVRPWQIPRRTAYPKAPPPPRRCSVYC